MVEPMLRVVRAHARDHRVSEIIYWTSPTFLGASTREFDRLLANKLVFSLISLALLVVVISFQEIFARERGDKKVAASASA